MMFSLKKSIFYIKALSSSKAFKNTTPFRCFHVFFVLKITFIVLHLNLNRSIILRKSHLFNILSKKLTYSSTQQNQYGCVEFPCKDFYKKVKVVKILLNCHVLPDIKYSLQRCLCRWRSTGTMEIRASGPTSLAKYISPLSEFRINRSV